MQQVREDFDRIALLMAHEVSAPETYSNFLLRHVPAGCNNILDIGCGFGAFARRIAPRAERFTAIDLSPQMIKVAKERSQSYSNLDFVLGDFLKLHLPAESYDCIVTLATLHHLPLSEALSKMKSLLSPGGTLIIHDMMATNGYFKNYAFDAVRVPISMAVRLWQRGSLLPRREVRKAWTEHGKRETYLTAKEVRAIRDEHLPGGSVYLHLLWRYTIIWRKPGTAE
jgi:ubiquinone/menaquinone biosynthesis C-methylase UbiE